VLTLLGDRDDILLPHAYVVRGTNYLYQAVTSGDHTEECPRMHGFVRERGDKNHQCCSLQFVPNPKHCVPHGSGA
jgi:hypothetical protein